MKKKLYFMAIIFCAVCLMTCLVANASEIECDALLAGDVCYAHTHDDMCASVMVKCPPKSRHEICVQKVNS